MSGSTFRLIVPVVVSNGSARTRTYALLDGGATNSAITSRLAERLNLGIASEFITMSTFNYKGGALRRVCNCDVGPLDDSFKVHLRNVLVGEILSTEADRPPCLEDIQDYPHLEGIVTFTELEDSDIEMIISAELAWTWESGERIVNHPEQPIAIHTAFGWSLIGPTGEFEENPTATLSCYTATKDTPIQEYIDLMHRHDFTARDGERSSPEVEHPSRNDRYAVHQFETTIQFDENLRHYKIGLPWRVNREHAAEVLNKLDSKTNAIDRLRKATSRMKREPPRREGVWNTIQRFIERGQAVEITNESVPPNTPVFYLPIHIVTKPNKPGKFRVCSDGAAKVSGICLNDLLLSGPDLNNRIVGVILRFRRHEIALSADIEGFYHHVYVDDRDNAVFRFMWWKDKEMTQMVPMEMKVHVFGATSSPAVATYVLRHHADKIKNEVSPMTVKAIKTDFYVDDLLSSLASREEAQQLRSELQTGLDKGGFHLCKWKCTHPGVIGEEYDKEMSKQEEKLLEDATVDTYTDRVLGIAYSFQTDLFTIRIGTRAKQPVHTRREVLSLLASVYDPLGFAAPALLRGKIIFQAATALKLDWDDPLPSDLDEAFESWRSNLPALERLRIPRWFADKNTTSGNAQLHVFSDASVEGYGVAVYTRMTDEKGHCNVNLVFARAHVVPIEMMTRITKDQEDHGNSIPRLELTAARLSTTVQDMVTREIAMEFDKVVFWTDSECVLKWIFDEKTRFKTFIHNRLSKIHQLSRPNQWRYVPTELNPADDCSRGLEPNDTKWERFLGGPEFLKKGEDEWPTQKRLPPKEKIMTINALTTTRSHPPNFDWVLAIAERVEKWSSKVRRVSLFCNFIKQWKLKRNPIPRSFPTMQDMKNSERKLLTAIQQHSFRNDIKTIAKNNITTNTSLTLLHPFLDSDGVLRAGGRLNNSTSISYDHKHPIILPKENPNLRALIREEHEKLGHAGTNHIFAHLGQRFWIINGRELVKSTLQTCITCQRIKKPLGNQLMGDLPKDRVDVMAPFEATGIDAFGPFQVRHGGRGQAKRWVIIFTCLSCRAVHFEIIRDMTSSCFINALVRFHARRPGLRVLFSDCGTNFKGANGELRRSIQQWNESTHRELVSRGIEWRFSPPKSPHWGGLWERLIRETKKHLTILLTSQVVDVEIFSTTLAEVERILNSRPLTYASSDIRDLAVLRPSDFLYPGVVTHTSTNILPLKPVGGNDMRSRWTKTRELTDLFWTRWSKEYLTTLQRREKWSKTKPALYVGQLVLIADDNLTRDQWKIGRIQSLRGDGPHPRTATVQTADRKQYERHVSRLVTLEVE